MSKPNIPLSWSRISGYRQCPRQFEAKNLTKTYPDEGDNPAFEKGSRVHKQLEDYINYMKLEPGSDAPEPALCSEALNAKRMIDSFFNKYDRDSIHAEKQLAFKSDYRKCSWFDNVDTVHWRVIIDMLVFKANGHLDVIDWKTGKVRDYDDNNGQLHLTAMLLFEKFPDVTTITCSYCFVEHKQTIRRVFHRKDHEAIKASFELEHIKINEDTEFKPTKNKYCYFCLLTTRNGGLCEYG